MQTIQYYVLFPNHDSGMRLYQELKSLDIRAVIAPTPRSASKCCGISLLVQEDDLPVIKHCASGHGIDILDIVGIEKNINPNRDQYC